LEQPVLVVVRESNQMILTTIQLPLEGASTQSVLRTIRTLLEPTRVETGCLKYEAAQDIEDAHTLIILEKWTTEEDFRNHVRSESFRAVLSALELARRQPEICIHHVSSIGGLEAIRRMRGVREHERDT
jgi:quinol monooxygenase YgiN